MRSRERVLRVGGVGDRSQHQEPASDGRVRDPGERHQVARLQVPDPGQDDAVEAVGSEHNQQQVDAVEEAASKVAGGVREHEDGEQTDDPGQQKEVAPRAPSGRQPGAAGHVEAP